VFPLRALGSSGGHAANQNNRSFAPRSSHALCGRDSTTSLSTLSVSVRGSRAWMVTTSSPSLPATQRSSEFRRFRARAHEEAPTVVAHRCRLTALGRTRVLTSVERHSVKARFGADPPQLEATRRGAAQVPGRPRVQHGQSVEGCRARPALGAAHRPEAQRGDHSQRTRRGRHPSQAGPATSSPELASGRQAAGVLPSCTAQEQRRALRQALVSQRTCSPRGHNRRTRAWQARDQLCRLLSDGCRRHVA
jgi:hypothetical protein